LLFSAGGQNAAHRSWAFSFIGLAAVMAVGVQDLHPVRRVRHAAMSASRVFGLRAALTLLCLVLLVGAYGAGVNTVELFPGPFALGSDGRNVPAELYNVAGWFRVNAKPGQVVLADYRTSVLITTEANELPNEKLAAALVVPPTGVSASVIQQVRDTASYVVIDDRLATQASSEGYYFDAYEPRVVQPLGEASISKLADYSWLRVVHRTDHYTVYEVQR
jgi:hypothetical protein